MLPPFRQYAYGLQRIVYLWIGQPYYREVAAVYLFYQHRRRPLYAVCAGFVHRLACGYIVAYFVRLERFERDFGLVIEYGFLVTGYYGNAREHGVRAAAEHGQYVGSIFFITRFAQNFAVKVNYCVGAEHAAARVFLRNGC